MEFLTQLWIPIVLSAVAVFFCSFLFWAALDLHRKDHRKLPDEEGFSASLRSLGVGPGTYFFPYCEDKAQQRDPEYAKRMTEGPTGTLTVWGNVSMGRNMALSFLTNLIASLLIAYLAWNAIGAYEGFLHPLRIVATAGILTYSFGFITHDLWFSAPGGAIARKIRDGVVYGVVTGLIFALLWPGA